jgi:hypothetical protein
VELATPDGRIENGRNQQVTGGRLQGLAKICRKDKNRILP